MAKAGPLDQQAAMRGTPRERSEYVDARRVAGRERDERRIGLAASEGGRFAIEQDRGFATAGPGALGAAGAVVEDALALIERLGTDLPSSGKDHLTTNLLPRESLTLESSFMRLALDDQVLDAVSAYLGIVPVVTTVDVWHSRPVGGEPRSSQLLHLDFADVSQVKLFVHCTDVDDDAGPLTVLDAGRSSRLAEETDYRIGGGGRLSDERVAGVLGDEALVRLTGPRGTVHFVDTSRCFHFGSRLREGSPPRTVAMIQYLTPYAFKFERDHREEAPFRDLAADSMPERARLVLGAG